MTASPDEASAATAPDDASVPADVDSLGELVVAVLWDGVIGAAAGAVGNVAILAALLVAYLLGGFDPASFGTVAEVLGLHAVISGDQLLLAGLVIFVIGGMTVLPLLLATLGLFLPGERYATSGVVFGAIVWTGFVIAYYVGYSGTGLVVYLVTSLLGHIGYGYVTGWMMDKLFAEEGRPLITSSILSPGAIMEAPTDADGVPKRETTLVDDGREETEERS